MSEPREVLVTGANGFIGRALCEQLVARGDRVRGMTRRGVPLGQGVVPLVMGDLAGTVEWERALSGVSVVVHSAARAHVLKDGAADPLETFRVVNRDATLTLARAAARAGARRFVFLSSIGVLGERTAPGHPFTARSEPAPTAPYAISKLEAEVGLAEVAAETGMEVVVVRPPLVHGPGAPGNFGRLVGLVAKGWPLPLAGLSNRRSFVGRRNLVDLLIRTLDHPDAPGAPLLVSDDHPISTSELVILLASALGRPARLFPLPGLGVIGHLPGVGGAIRKLTESLEVDLTDTTARLGWRPQVSVADGLAEMARARQGAR